MLVIHHTRHQEKLFYFYLVLMNTLPSAWITITLFKVVSLCSSPFLVFRKNVSGCHSLSAASLGNVICLSGKLWDSLSSRQYWRKNSSKVKVCQGNIDNLSSLPSENEKIYLKATLVHQGNIKLKKGLISKITNTDLFELKNRRQFLSSVLLLLIKWRHNFDNAMMSFYHQ